ncbi:MAG TPA: hypothetical protein VK862_10675 [Afifellaceae bacterium]|nr:hypothetical protein [Afifellaceae bacterium]
MSDAAGGSATVNIGRAGGRMLNCGVGRHVVVTDRKVEDGGSDTGCVDHPRRYLDIDNAFG